jgi:hypothetical protein
MVVTVLSPPVGGLSRPIRSDSCSRRKRSRGFSRYGRGIRSFARATLVSVSHLVRHKRRIITEWDLLNTRERGGIAKPSVFVIDSGLVVRYASVDTVVTRVPASEILSFLVAAGDLAQIRRKAHFPRPRLDTRYPKQFSEKLTQTRVHFPVVGESVCKRLRRAWLRQCPELLATRELS